MDSQFAAMCLGAIVGTTSALVALKRYNFLPSMYRYVIYTNLGVGCLHVLSLSILTHVLYYLASSSGSSGLYHLRVDTSFPPLCLAGANQSATSVDLFVVLYVSTDLILVFFKLGHTYWYIL
ncbi:hypothetical protein B0T18DRAFT_175755 [Schizothecium vesticola]|uniref:Uncharacterized protein n=1 Tax=Schizothecium vesticola TaxID=314040 RepID=A0AA40EPH9_9PEZI|nr:hypothetical protein B0T18DRAFT_175755 [Schizothecium vesticola]